MLQRARVIARLAQEAGLSPARLEEAIAAPRRAASVVFLGPPGVGKGTYASRVADALGLAHISAGDLVRHEMKEQTELGRKVGGLSLHPLACGSWARTSPNRLCQRNATA